MFRVSSATERLVGRLDQGDEFVEELTRICKNQNVIAGEVRAVGHFDAIELVHFNVQTQRYETLVDGEGSFDLVSLNGNVSRLGDEVVLRLDAVINVMGPLGPQMVGGQLRRARVLSGEFVIESFADLIMERRLDAKTGRLVLDRIERIAGAAAPAAYAEKPAAAVSAKAAPAKEAPVEEPAHEEPAEHEEASMSWGEAIAEVEQTEKDRSARRSRPAPKRAGGRTKEDHDPYEDLNLDEPWMRPGDYLDHPKLGRCRVMKVEDDNYAHIRLPGGRIRKLVLEILDVRFKGEEGGQNVFEARIRK